jgi:DNA helicase II / ATP-dependent DNA helicase PcrA
VAVIREHAKNHSITLWQALVALLAQKQFATRTDSALQNFVRLIENLRVKSNSLDLPHKVDYMLHSCGLIDHYRKEKSEKALTRVENLEELVNAAHQFAQEGVADDLPPLTAFLAYAALESNEEQAANYEDAVQLMTLHSAKGLEFPYVFLAGCEEELFPHYLSLEDPKALEEERRLCYVGITRAMNKLYMTYAEKRRLHGKEVYHRPSRFLQELPKELVAEVRTKTKVTRPQTAVQFNYKPQAEGKFRIGQVVNHRIFGDGTVLDTEGDGDAMKVKVRFKSVGTKVLIASFLMAK